MLCAKCPRWKPVQRIEVGVMVGIGEGHARSDGERGGLSRPTGVLCGMWPRREHTVFWSVVAGCGRMLPSVLSRAYGGCGG